MVRIHGLSFGRLVFPGALFICSLLTAACEDAVLHPFDEGEGSDTTLMNPLLPANCLADDLDHDGVVDPVDPTLTVEDWSVCPCLADEDPDDDPDGDGVPSACDMCPSDNPDDADSDGLCDPSPTCWADLNGDSDVNVNDENRVILCWGDVTPPCLSADLNSDGEVGILDLDAVTGCWGPCPTAPGNCVDYYEAP